MTIAGKVAVITGATSGVGRACAVRFAADGALVVAAGRRVDLGDELQAEVRESGGEITFVRADVSRVEDCRALIQAVVDRHGGVDILINNAGVESEITDFHLLEEDEWDRVVDTNLKGTAFCCRFAIPSMLERGAGVILNIASINAVEGVAHLAPYNASKAGVVQLTRTLAAEYLLSGIRANSIVLGGADGATASRTQDGMARYMRGPDFVRNPEPNPLAAIVQQSAPDVAEAFAALCGDDLRLLTGATIALDRAMTAGFTASTLIHMTVSEIWSI